MLVNLWATWCAPCVQELPSLVKLQQAVPGLKVLAVDVGHDKPEKAAAFLKSHKAGSLGVYVDTELALLRAFGAYGLPHHRADRSQGQGSRQGARAGRVEFAAVHRLFQKFREPANGTLRREEFWAMARSDVRSVR